MSGHANGWTACIYRGKRWDGACEAAAVSRVCIKTCVCVRQYTICSVGIHW